MTDPGPDHQRDLWAAFVEAYTATTARGQVDMFLRAIIGRPRPERPA